MFSTLSSHALLALQQFKQEEEENRKKFELLYLQAEDDFDEQKAKEVTPVAVSIDDFKEDWQLSQFWYSDETSDIFAKELLRGADEDTVICIASAPAVYAALNRIPRSEWPTQHVYLLEYDTRFKLLAGASHFSFYDYNEPDNVPQHLRHKVDRLLIDPPFLEEDCQVKSSIAAKNLLTKDKHAKTKTGDLKYKMISSTGERMRDVIKRIYPDTHITTFYPEHKNGLSNEFRCYATFEGEAWNFQDN